MAIMRIVGYSAFFLLAFIVGLYWSFPFDVAKDQLLKVASEQTQMTITAKSLEPSWVTGAVAKGIRIERPGAKDPIELAQVTARAHILPFLAGGRGVTLDMPVAKGQVHADIVQTSEGVDIKASASDLEVALVPGLADMTGVPVAGGLDLKVDLFTGNDPKDSQGTIELKGTGLEILEGGKVSDFPIPELAIGSFNWKIPVKDGKAKLERLEVKGDAVELKVDGQITLGSPLERSILSLKVGFKPTPAFLKANPLIEALLNNIRRTKGNDGFYNYNITGTIKNPRPFPQRR